MSSAAGSSLPKVRTMRHIYHPQHSCGKLMFLHLSVTLSTFCPPQADNPLGQIPLPLGRHPPGQTPPGRNPLGNPPHPKWPPKQILYILLECILVLLYTYLIVHRMVFNSSKSSYPWNSDQKCTQNSVRGYRNMYGRCLGSVGV